MEERETLSEETPPRAVPFSRAVRITLVVGAPTVVVLIGLVLFGVLEVVPALAGATAATVGTFMLVRLILSDLISVAVFLRDEAEGLPGSRVPHIRFVDSARDIAFGALMLRSRSRRRVAEARRKAAFHDSVIGNLPEPLLIVGSDGVVSQANTAARAVLGKETDNRPFVSAVRDPVLVEAVEGVLAGGERKVVSFEPAGPVDRSFVVTVETLKSENGEDPSAMVLLHDITDLIRAERMRADFVANASHELKTPLTSILGFIETLQGPARGDEEATERFLGIMFQQAQRMRRLIDDLLSLSRIELHEHTPPKSPVAVAGVVESVLEALQIQAKIKSVGLRAEIPDDLPAVLADPDELAQVLQNLLTNAIKYGLPNTDVVVEARAVSRGPASMPHSTRTDCVALAVSDQGDGIAKEHIPRLTERFYRVDTARSRQLGGTGLGLAIVKHIVTRHRGALTIESTLGKGSIFTVFLPSADGMISEAKRPSTTR